MKKKIMIDEVCNSCEGTGLHVGFAEHDGSAIVCHECKGEGHYKRTISWTPWLKSSKRKIRSRVKRVFLTNPGICIGENLNKKTGLNLMLEDFGGVDYKQWRKEGKKVFVKGTEMRKHTCPAWWFQSTDYNKKPDWDECISMGSFNKCKHFATKEKCWERFDKYGKKGK